MLRTFHYQVLGRLHSPTGTGEECQLDTLKKVSFLHESLTLLLCLKLSQKNVSKN